MALPSLPTHRKKKIEEQKLDPDTKAPILDKDGKIVTEEKEIEIPMFRPVKVFDVSQTDGKPLPELASSLSSNVPNYEAFMEALRRSAPVPITFSSVTIFPSLYRIGALVSGSSFCSSIFFLYGVGAMMVMPCSPFFT